MAASLVTLRGFPVRAGTIVMPAYGAWVATLTLTRAEPVDGTPFANVVTIGALSLVGTRLRSLDVEGSLAARVIGGGGGWSSSVAAKPYSVPSGVPASLVAADLASECGERLDLSAAGPGGSWSLGPRWLRMASSAASALDMITAVAPGAGSPVEGWWVGEDGTTRIGARASTLVPSRFDYLRGAGHRGRYEIATDHYEDWLPGVTFSSPQVSNRVGCVVHTFDAQSVVTEVLTWR